MKHQFFFLSSLLVSFFLQGSASTQQNTSAPLTKTQTNPMQNFVCADLTELPPGFMPFEEFRKEFHFEATTTEQGHPITKKFSQTMHRSISEGLEQLLQVDENVIRGLESFIPFIEKFAPQLADKIDKGGRIFLVGSGSSGRVAIDLAAKCAKAFPEFKNQIRGIIAGGDTAIIRAKEGFEDSVSDGMKALQGDDLGANDTVILISASGSASFNVGCGNFAADCGSTVFYFYNSTSIPSRTQALFDRKNNPAISLCIDIGPQAIAGSTRLQAATIAEAGLGSLLASSLHLSRGENDLARQYPTELVQKMKEGILLIRKNLDQIAQFIVQEKEVFSDPRSNFRRLEDQSDRGYVTFIAAEDSMREVLIDSTETSPTFSTNPIRRENEAHKKRAEFRAYLLGKQSNALAWEALLGRPIHQDDVKDKETFLLSCHSEGVNSYQKRPVADGNFLIAVAKVKKSEPLRAEMFQLLEESRQQGGKTGLMLICKGRSEDPVKKLRHVPNALCVIDNIPEDTLGLAETIILKQTLNLISNGSMALMNKIQGNQMIDMRASNKKLIDRAMRLIKEVYSEYRQDSLLTDEQLYHWITHTIVIKNDYEKNGIYTPSIVKIVLAMLALNKTTANFDEVVDFLNKKEERIDWIGEYS